MSEHAHTNTPADDDHDTLAVTESFIVWTSDMDGDTAYHVELGGITLHLTSEEWEELVVLIKSADQPLD